MSPTQAPTLLILAAGLGTRYGGLKQIQPVGPSGEAILDYSIYDALRAGFGKLVFVIRRDIEQSFRQAVSARFESRIAVEYVFQDAVEDVIQDLDKLPAGFTRHSARTRPWGTAHAILVAADAIREPFATINADDFYGAESYRLLAQHLKSGSDDYAMVAFTLSNTLSEFGVVSRGVCRVNSSGYLENVIEMTAIAADGMQLKNTDSEGRVIALTGDEPVSMNSWGFTPSLFPQLRERFESFLHQRATDPNNEWFLPAVVSELVANGDARVKVLRTSDEWFGLTYPQDHRRAVESIQRLVRHGVYPERLWP